MKNRLRKSFILGMTAFCLLSVSAYAAGEGFTAPQAEDENTESIFSSGSQYEEPIQENNSNIQLFADGLSASENDKETVIQDGIIYEANDDWPGGWVVTGYTEELKGVSRISIPIQVNGKLVRVMASKCFYGMENINAIDIPGCVYLSVGILESWEGVTMYCSANSPAYYLAQREAPRVGIEIAYDTSTMPTTYYKDGNGIVYLFDWEEMAYTAGTIDIANFTGKKSIVYKNEIDGYPVTSIDTEKLAAQYIDDQPLCFNYVTEIVIPDGIGEIIEGEFSLKLLYDVESGYKNLTRVVFEEGETPIELGKNLFNACTSLTEVRFSSRVRELPERTFMNCPAMTKLELPEGMAKIGQGALQGVPNLEYLYIPSSVTEIADDAMDGLTKLTVHGKANSYGEYYCRAHGIPFEAEGSIGQEKPYIVTAEGELKNHWLYFTVGLLREMDGAEGYEYQTLASDGETVLRTKNAPAPSCTLAKAPNDIYVRVRSWKTENGEKAYSEWSNTAHLYLDVKAGDMALKKAAANGGKVTLTFGDNANFFKESDGFDCQLEKTSANGTTYVRKNQKYRTVTFTNVKPGTYTAKARAYKLVNGEKVYGDRSNTIRVVVR